MNPEVLSELDSNVGLGVPLDEVMTVVIVVFCV